MKNIILFIGLGVLLVTSTVSAQNRNRNRSTGGSSGYTFGSPSASSESASLSNTESSFSSSTYNYEWGVGFSSAANIVYNNDTALTAVYHLNEKSLIQGYFIMDQVGGESINGLGAAYKYNLSGTAVTGFHVGGGLGLGKYSATKNFMHIVGIVGFHFPMHKKISVHIDGGLVFTNDDNATQNKKDSNLLIQGMSEHFGASLIYML